MRIIKIRYYILSILLVFAFLFYYLNKNLFYSSNLRYAFHDFISALRGEKIEKFSFNNLSKENLAFLDDDIAILSDANFIVLSQYSRKMLEIKHNFGSPVLRCSKYKALIFDSGGYDYTITSKSELINEGKIQDKIIMGEISEKDNLVFITESDEYNCEMKVININGADKFHYCFANMYVIDVSINNSGDKIVAYGMKSDNGKIKSIVQIFDIKEKTPIFSKELDDEFNFVNFFDDKDCMLIGNESVICIKGTGREVLEMKLHKQVCLFSFDKDVGAAITISPSNDYRNQKVIVINKNCQKISEINTRKKLKSIYFKSKIISVMSENQVVANQLDGKVISQEKVPSNCRLSFLLPKTSKLVTLGTNDLSFL